ncbi:MAG: hypothetical protein OXL40_12735 [Bacteroidota bacterium]|nr:hypothetical protein [Bacteroidota bacterium]
MRCIALWLLVVLLMPKGNHYGYERVFFIHADTDSVVVEGDLLRGQQEGDEFVQYVDGNVRVTLESTKVTADRAIRNVTRRTSTFTGEVVLVDEGDTLRADSLHFEEELEIGYAAGNVRLSDGEVVARAPMGTHYVEERRAVFPQGLLLEDSISVLSAEAGVYQIEDKVADLTGNVKMESENAELTSDSLTHYRDFAISLARGSVLYLTVSGEDSTWIAGERVERNAKDSLSIVRGNPLLVHFERDSLSVDTLIIGAGAFRIQESQKGFRLDAMRDVRVWKTSFAARADSVVYDRPENEQDESAWLYGQPLIWTDDIQLSGDTVGVVTTEGTIDSLFIRGSAFVAEEDSLTKRINQARGKGLVGTFRGDSVRVFRVGPNAEAIFFRNSEDGEFDLAVDASGDEIYMQIEGDYRRITFSTDVQATWYHDGSVLPDTLVLDGLRWEPNLRPTREQLLSHPLVSTLRWNR